MQPTNLAHIYVYTIGPFWVFIYYMDLIYILRVIAICFLEGKIDQSWKAVTALCFVNVYLNLGNLKSYYCNRVATFCLTASIK